MKHELSTTNQRLTPAVALQGVTVADPSFLPRAEEFILKALFRLGQSKDDMTLSLLVGEFVKDIRHDFGTLTIQEVEIALDKGVKEKDLTMINNKTLYFLVKEYAQSNVRLTAKKDLPQEALPPVMDREKSYQLWRETVLKQFAEYKKTGRFLVEFPRLLFKRQLMQA